MTALAQQPQTGTAFDVTLAGVDGQLRVAFHAMCRLHLENNLGMPLDRAAEELRRIEGLRDSPRKLYEYYRGGTGLQGPGQAAAARSAIGHLRIADALFPAVLGLATLAVQEYNGARLAKEQAERRKELRNGVSRTVDDLVRQVLRADAAERGPGGDWAAAHADVRRGLDELMEPRRSLVLLLEARAAELRDAGERLRGLLAAPPA